MFEGINLTLLIGPKIPVPATYDIMKSLVSLEIRNTDEGRDAFQITLSMGREGKPSTSLGLGPISAKVTLDYNLLNNPLIKPFNRIIMIVTVNKMPKVLFDGLITNIQTLPSNSQTNSSASLIITGEDLSLMMNLKESPETFENMSDSQIAMKIIASYAKYGIAPLIIPPLNSFTSTINEKLPSKCGNDFDYLHYLAKKNDNIFFIEPGPLPGTNLAYWGPKELKYRPKKPLNVNMGPDTNTSTISFQYDALSPISLTANVRIPFTKLSVPLSIDLSSRLSMAEKSPKSINQNNVREIKFRLDGLNVSESFMQAQSMVNKTMDSVTATGELDVIKYGEILRARSTVFVRGAGLTNDGIYYVKSVTHSINPGISYKQSFELSREGFGSILEKIG